jgi:hypothetical protein
LTLRGKESFLERIQFVLKMDNLLESQGTIGWQDAVDEYLKARQIREGTVIPRAGGMAPN